ncbi:protein ROOT PRIMORDIUM DEFECTIVE 1 [Phoenix dactylifera]|uniref:Protein ROOT PRIMORDIUM DEFECTIVE 1 n=1 Tax=Phoenix dactylifera TaxID=42345 RepID=A0A8B7D1L0_PHODC|nr:protein ROOT PRIMORDIUM DEFECTIVE 1 [Phoenix dactylifera]
MRARSALLPAVLARSKTTSAQYVAARHIDPTFEKLMDGYKHLLKVAAVQDLIIASPGLSLPLPLLSAAAPKLRLNRGAPHFVRTFPRVFSLHYDPSSSQALVRLAPSAAQVALQESSAASAAVPAAVDRLSRLLSMSPSRSLPLRAIFRIWKELGLPDDFEDSIIARNPTIFSLRDNPREPNTHLLELVGGNPSPNFTPAVEEWRLRERGREGSKADEMELRFGFKHGFPPGMRLAKNFRAKVKEWQRLPYVGPYDAAAGGLGAGSSKDRMKRMEKRAVGIAHEFLSLTVEKMVEVEKISQFRKWFGIELNIRDLFLDHPGIFYLSTKGKRHTVFLREAYDRGRLIDPNPVYEARRRLLELVLMRRRGLDGAQLGVEEPATQEEEEEEEEESGSAADDV